MTDYTLSTEELSLLKKGLGFVPTTRYDAFTWLKDIDLFLRKLRWKKFFKQHDDQTCHQLVISDEDLPGVRTLVELLDDNTRGYGEDPYTDLRPKSKQTPPLMDYSEIDIFQKVVSDELNTLSSTSPCLSSNLTSKEKNALVRLEKNNSFVIKQSDKGGNLVIMNHSIYKAIIRDLLSIEGTYRILDGDPSETFLSQLETLLVEALDEKIISKNECNFMLSKHPQLATFYALPKVHKGLDPLRGRPIVSGVSSITQNVGIYLDRVLRNFVLSLPSYLRDSSDLLNKLEDIVLDNHTLLASIDVEALYSSIPHQCGLRAVSYFLHTRGVQYARHNQLIIDLLHFILTHNHFVFVLRKFAPGLVGRHPSVSRRG